MSSDDRPWQAMIDFQQYAGGNLSSEQSSREGEAGYPLAGDGFATGGGDVSPINKP